MKSSNEYLAFPRIYSIYLCITNEVPSWLCLQGGFSPCPTTVPVHSTSSTQLPTAAAATRYLHHDSTACTCRSELEEGSNIPQTMLKHPLRHGGEGEEHCVRTYHGKPRIDMNLLSWFTCHRHITVPAELSFAAAKSRSPCEVSPCQVPLK